MTVRKILKALNPRLKWRGVRGLRYNEDGVSAVEFALIAPVLIMLYLGCIELSFLMRVDRRVTSTSAAMGDLTARLTAVTDDDLDELFDAASIMLQPYSVSNSRLRITSIVDTGNGVKSVAWSEGYNMTPLAAGSTVTVPAGLVPSPGSVILSEVEYDYTGTFGYVIDTSRTVADKFYLRPRRVNEIPREDDGGAFGS